MTRTVLWVILILFATSCARRLTYDQWAARYVSTKIDTTYQTVNLTIPRDSVVFQVRTDTVPITHTVRQGRATLTFTRDRHTTTANCECDTASIQKKVPQQIIRKIAGVDPEFQKKAETRLTIIWCLLGLIGVAALVYLFTHQFRITRR